MHLLHMPAARLLVVRDAVTDQPLVSTPLNDRSVRFLLGTAPFKVALAVALYPRAFGPVETALHLEVEGDDVPACGHAVLLRWSGLSPRHDWTADDATRRELRFEVV